MSVGANLSLSAMSEAWLASGSLSPPPNDWPTRTIPGSRLGLGQQSPVGEAAALGWLTELSIGEED